MQKFTPKQYLRIDIANSFGKDKLTWNERLNWFRENQETLLANPVKAVVDADEPAQALAGLMAYQAMLDNKPIGYTCGLDATASGLQLLALFAGCEQSASMCNLISTGSREDAYTRVYTAINELLDTDGEIPRDDVKGALMTHLYGSKAVPKKTFGEGTKELTAFYEVVGAFLPGADTLNHSLLKLWNPQALSHKWTLPDGFEVVIKSEVAQESQVQFMGSSFTVVERVNAPKAESKCLGANIIHSVDGLVVREMNRRCNYTADTINHYQEMHYVSMPTGKSTCRDKDIQLLRLLELAEVHQFVSAVIFEYVDEQNFGHIKPDMRTKLINLIDSMPSTSFPILCIHDCIKFHPNYGNDVRYQYVKIFSELAGSTVMNAITTEIVGKKTTVRMASHRLPELIMKSEYALS